MPDEALLDTGISISMTTASPGRSRAWEASPYSVGLPVKPQFMYRRSTPTPFIVTWLGFFFAFRSPATPFWVPT